MTNGKDLVQQLNEMTLKVGSKQKAMVIEALTFVIKSMGYFEYMVFNSNGDVSFLCEKQEHFETMNDLPTFVYQVTENLEFKLIEEIFPAKQPQSNKGKVIKLNGKIMNATYYYNHIKTLNGVSFDRDVAQSIMKNFISLGYKRLANEVTEELSLVVLCRDKLTIKVGKQTSRGKTSFYILKHTR